MKRILKIVAAILAVPIIWASVFMLYLGNWGNTTARQMEVKYDRVGYPQGGIVLMGSSSMQVWTDSAADLGPLHTVNVGIGGTVVDNWVPLVDTLVTPFSPKGVVVYIGANDLHNNQEPPSQVAAEIQQLLEQIHGSLPSAKLYYVSVYTTGAHTHMRADDEAVNAYIQALAQQLDYLEYIDCATALLDANGEVQNEVFLADLVHLNETGYALWTKEIRAALLRDFPVTEESL